MNLVRDPRSRFWSQINAKLHDLHLLNDPEDAINNKRRHRHFHLLNDDAEDSSEPEAETENPLRAHIVHNMTNRHALVCKNNGDDIIKCLTQVLHPCLKFPTTAATANLKVNSLGINAA